LVKPLELIRGGVVRPALSGKNKKKKRSEENGYQKKANERK